MRRDPRMIIDQREANLLAPRRDHAELDGIKTSLGAARRELEVKADWTPVTSHRDCGRTRSAGGGRHGLGQARFGGGAESVDEKACELRKTSAAAILPQLVALAVPTECVSSPRAASSLTARENSKCTRRGRRPRCRRGASSQTPPAYGGPLRRAGTRCAPCRSRCKRLAGSPAAISARRHCGAAAGSVHRRRRLP